MVLNRFEYTKISNDKLPLSWQSQGDLDDLSDFLQQNWEQRSVFYNDEDTKSQQQFLDFLGSKSIKTKKYIGTIVFKGEQLNIYPRVFSTEPSDHDADGLDQKYLLNNLVHWIEYCNKLDYPFLNISSEFSDIDNLLELFISLYIGYVSYAIGRGMFHQYVEEIEDCSNIKGKFDLVDYITQKIPTYKSDKFRCSYSKFEFDNKVNRIIKCTCRQLINITSKSNQKKLKNILNRLNEVSDVVCVPHDCDNIHLSKMHRYYDIVISMSKMFLLNKLSNYSVDNQKAFCFLFPTDLLFEGFIGGFFKQTLKTYGGIVKLQESRMSLVEKIIYKGQESSAAFTMRHDILAELNNKIFILDTKYKELSRFEDNPNFRDDINQEAKQSDLYQVLEYARKRDLKDVYLLYPMYRYENNESEYPTAISESPSGNINIHFIRIPFVFEENIDHTKQQLKEVITSIFDIN